MTLCLIMSQERRSLCYYSHGEKKAYFLFLLRNEDPNLDKGANCFSESITRACPGTTALEEPWHTMMNLKEKKTTMKK